MKAGLQTHRPTHTHACLYLQREGGSRLLASKENGYYGTYHSGELIYAYGNVKKSPYPYRYNQSDIDLSERMLNYWVNFVKNGDPNYEESMQWTPYFKSEAKIMELGENVGLIKDPYMDLYPIIDDYIDYRIDHPKVEK